MSAAHPRGRVVNLSPNKWIHTAARNSSAMDASPRLADTVARDQLKSRNFVQCLDLAISNVLGGEI